MLIIGIGIHFGDDDQCQKLYATADWQKFPWWKGVRNPSSSTHTTLKQSPQIHFMPEYILAKVGVNQLKGDGKRIIPLTETESQFQGLPCH